MSSSNQRKQETFKHALPLMGSKEYEKILDKLKQRWANNPDEEKWIKERFDTAIKTIKLQQKNGAGLPCDVELRSLHWEYNSRTIEQGLRTMPSSYNVMEAFFNYRKRENFFELLDEEFFIVSFYDFIDFITSPEFDEKSVKIEDTLVDDLVYHFNISNSIDEITFSDDEGNDSVIGGISLVKRGNEVVVFLICGLKGDLSHESKKLLHDLEDTYVPPGKESIVPAPDLTKEAVALFGNGKYWKTFAFCRFDLTTQTIDTRYIQKDAGIGYMTETDDVSIYLDATGKLPNSIPEEYLINSIKQIDKYSHIFDVASKCLYLPYYFDFFDSHITIQQYPTELDGLPSKPRFAKEKNVPLKQKIKVREVYKIDRQKKPQGDVVTFYENEFKIEKSGFWKQLQYDAIGKDKRGNEIQGRTWVDKTLSYFESNSQPLKVTFSETKYNNANAGYIYLMRSAAHDTNIFKIGLTRRTSEKRAKELSSTTASPDKFLVANEWETVDCVVAEALIHEKLKSFRLNDKREYFRISFKRAMLAIQEIVDKVNKIEDSNS